MHRCRVQGLGFGPEDLPSSVSMPSLTDPFPLVLKGGTPQQKNRRRIMFLVSGGNFCSLLTLLRDLAPALALARGLAFAAASLSLAPAPSLASLAPALTLTPVLALAPALALPPTLTLDLAPTLVLAPGLAPAFALPATIF